MDNTNSFKLFLNTCQNAPKGDIEQNKRTTEQYQLIILTTFALNIQTKTL